MEQKKYKITTITLLQVAQALDDSVTQEVTNHLFQEPGDEGLLISSKQHFCKTVSFFQAKSLDLTWLLSISSVVVNMVFPDTTSE